MTILLYSSSLIFLRKFNAYTRTSNNLNKDHIYIVMLQNHNLVFNFISYLYQFKQNMLVFLKKRTQNVKCSGSAFAASFLTTTNSWNGKKEGVGSKQTRKQQWRSQLLVDNKMGYVSFNLATYAKKGIIKIYH